MCTALTLVTKDNKHLFGRNMDIEYSFNQSVGFIPRTYEYINKSTMKKEKTKYAIVGMITMMENHPMFADGLNEKGLACAGLNFPGYSYLESELKEDKVNIPAYDLMFNLLSNYENLEEVKEAIKSLNLMDTQINPQVPAPTLHWIVSDKTGKSIVIEKTIDGLKIFDNELGVLTNAPTFDWHSTNVRQYLGLYADQALDTKWNNKSLAPLGVGTGSVGLPGDFTPASRFIRVAFLRHFAMKNDKDSMGINEFFHILGNVAMVRGSVKTPENKSDITQYTSCMNQEEGIYYYNNYENNQINAVNMHNEDLDGKEIKLFEYKKELTINNQN